MDISVFILFFTKDAVLARRVLVISLQINAASVADGLTADGLTADGLTAHRPDEQLMV